MAWLKEHVLAILTSSSLGAVLLYLAKKFGDKFLDALPSWLKKRRERFLTDFADFYREEMAMHAHAFVSQSTNDGGSAKSYATALETITQWRQDSRPFLILFGERGIGKSRSCIELAKQENSARTGIRRRDRVRWINIKGYRTKPPSEFCEALDPLIKEGAIYIYDSYRGYEGFLEPVADLVFRKHGKLLVVSPEAESPAKKLASTATPLSTMPAPMAQDSLREVIKARASKVGTKIDDVTMDKIWGIAKTQADYGLPGIAVLAVDRVAKRHRLEGIDTLDDLYYSIFFDLENQLKNDWPKIKPLLGRMVLLRGIPKEAIKDYSATIASALSAGQLVLENGYLRIKPDILNDWMANRTFFNNGSASLDFDLILDDETVNTRSVEILTTLINLGRRDEAAKLLKRVAGQAPRTVIELGVLACEGFKEIDFVESNLGPFWDHVWKLEDPDLYNRVATVLSNLGKPKEANARWARAAALYETAKNFWGVAQAQSSIAAMYFRLNNWDQAEKSYLLALAAVEKVQGELGPWGAARLHNNIGLMHANKGAWEKAVQEQQRARKIYEQVPGDRGMQGMGLTDLILGSYYHRVGDLDQAQTYYERARQTLEKSRDWSGLARAYSNLSLVYADIGDWKAAQEHDAQALNILNELGDSRTIADVYKSFAGLYGKKGDYQEAIRCYMFARETLMHLEDAIGTAEIDMLLGGTYERQGDRVRAVEQFQRSGRVFADLGDARNHAYCELELGNVYYNNSDWDGAQRQYSIAGAEFEKIQDDRGKALVAVNLGNLAQQKGLCDEAKSHYDKALEIFNCVKDQLSAANTLQNIGRLLQTGYGDLDEALGLYREALEITEKLGAFRENMEAYRNIASIYLAQGRTDDALELYASALAGFQAMKCRYEEARTQLNISSIHEKREELGTAMDLCQSALKIGKELENADLIADANSALGWLYERQADWTNAARLLEDALGILKKIQAPLALAEASRSLGWIYYRRGDLDAVERCCDESEKILAGVQYRIGLARVYELRAHVASQKGNFEQTFKFYELAERIRTDLSDLSGLARLYNNKALAKQGVGQIEEAISLCKQSLELSRKFGEKRLESYSETILGMCYRDQHEWEKAEEHFNLGIQIKIKLDDKYGLAYSDAEVGVMDRQRGLLDQAEAHLTRAFKSFLTLGSEGDARRVAQEIAQMAEMFRAQGEDHRAKAIEGIIASFR